MTKRTQEQWRSLFTEQQASGLKINEFCRQNTLCPNYFSKRRKQLLNPEKKSTSSSPFVSVRPTTATESSTFSIHYEQTIMTLPITVSPDWLATLLQQLKA